MPKWRTVRDHLLYAHSESLIDDEEFILLFDLYTAKSPDLPYWKYDEFDLDLGDMCLFTSALRASVNKSHIPSLPQNNLYL